MKRSKQVDQRPYGALRGSLMVATVVVAAATSAALGQATNEITQVDPVSAVQGTYGLLVSFTLDTDFPPAPPAGEMPDSVMIGDLVGSSVTHPTQYVITAVFDIPSSELTGLKDATITFSPPTGGTLTFSMADGFEVLAGADTPPTVVQQPQSQTIPPGGAVTFTVVASGTAPLTYQWQKDSGDISGATDASYTINPVDWVDAGNYRCVVTNDFGTDTSDEAVLTVAELPTGAYPVVDTAQVTCYDTSTVIADPLPGETYYGQDAQFNGNQPSYAISGDELTVHDNVTGLTWMRDPDLNGDGVVDVDDKRTFAEAPAYADTLNLQNFGGYDDWRVPSIKELYSLMDFRGTDPMSDNTANLTPFIDTDYFYFGYGDLAASERIIDSQWVTTSLTVDTVLGGSQGMFGVNFADGRIKGYPTSKLFYVRLCRGNTDYGVNNFVDNGDGTVTDHATGLMWSQDDSGDGVNFGPRSGMTWVAALVWVEQKNAELYLGHNDWRMPNAKEMQSIVDYLRAPGATSSAAIDSIFNTTQITNEGGDVDYPWFWTGTTHVREDGSGTAGAYVCFGRGMGYWDSVWQDVHGAGCQRSDGKDGNFTGYTYVTDGYYFGDAPQADASRMYNYVRLVRDAGPLWQAGDMNCDGDVDFGDINPFVDALTDPAAYEADYPDCDINNADVSANGSVGFDDINPFVALLLGT